MEEKYTRQLANGEYEIKTTRLHVTSSNYSGESFTTALETPNPRRHLYFYNKTAAASGELYIGSHGVQAATGFPIPKGTLVPLPICNSVPLYFCTEAGQLGDLRIIEIA